MPQIWRVYIPLLAADPDPQTRKALFALLSKSIAPSLLAPTKALDLFFPLPSPFFDSPLLRPAGLHFLRGLIVSPGSLAWLQGSNLERLETEVFSLPFSTGQRPEAWDVDHDLSGETWIRGPGPIAVVLALNIYALLVTRDVNNEVRPFRPSTTRLLSDLTFADAHRPERYPPSGRGRRPKGGLGRAPSSCAERPASVRDHHRIETLLNISQPLALTRCIA